MPLSVGERQEFEQHERTITGGLQTFYDVGRALVEIRNKRLYREKHTTFEAYCREIWGFSRPHAYRLIDAAEVAANISPNGDTLPENEAQVRALKAAPGEKQKEVWAKAQATAPDGKVTAAHITDVIQTEIPMPPEPEPVPQPRPQQISVFVPVEMQPAKPVKPEVRALTKKVLDVVNFLKDDDPTIETPEPDASIELHKEEQEKTPDTDTQQQERTTFEFGFHTGDRNKIISAGLRLFRAVYFSHCTPTAIYLKEFTKSENDKLINGSWKVFKRYGSLSEMKTEMKSLNNDKHIIFENYI